MKRKMQVINVYKVGEGFNVVLRDMVNRRETAVYLTSEELSELKVETDDTVILALEKA